MGPLTDVRDISRLAYGFMASKALFSALNLGLFDQLSGHTKTLAELIHDTGIASNRLLTLLTALVSLGLVIHENGRYRNAPASDAYLVSTAPAYFGDYYRWQIDRQIYPQLEQLDAALRGEPVQPLYDLMHNQAEAEQFSRAQHAGSLGPAAVLAKVVDLSDCHRLLDVAGGSGAFSITLCRRYPQMTATIIDFPNVIEVAKHFVSEAGLADVIAFIPGNAVETAWPARQDAVLMSYLLSGVSEHDIVTCVHHAFSALSPGGRLILHDFMVQDDRTGPVSAALWFLPLLFTPEAVSLTPGWLGHRLTNVGFRVMAVQDMLPGITKLILATKPDDADC